jgi:uncharacterized protein (UPF0332 family)
VSAADHIALARRNLSFARYALAGGYADKACRAAYLAGSHPALAFIFARSGKSPKTHSGTRSEFVRMARDEPQLTHEQIAFLGWTYELKTSADFGQDLPVPLAEAERAIAEASRMVDGIAAILGVALIPRCLRGRATNQTAVEIAAAQPLQTPPSPRDQRLLHPQRPQ